MKILGILPFGNLSIEENPGYKIKETLSNRPDLNISFDLLPFSNSYGEKEKIITFIEEGNYELGFVCLGFLGCFEHGNNYLHFLEKKKIPYVEFIHPFMRDYFFPKSYPPVGTIIYPAFPEKVSDSKFVNKCIREFRKFKLD